MEDVTSVVRSTILSQKGGVSLRNLNHNYRTLSDENIPYRRFGFEKLEDFIKTIPNLQIRKKDGEWYVEAIATADTAHISAMISKQKNSKPNRKKAPLSKPRSMTRRSNYNSSNSNNNNNSRRNDFRQNNGNRPNTPNSQQSNRNNMPRNSASRSTSFSSSSNSRQQNNSAQSRVPDANQPPYSNVRTPQVSANGRESQNSGTNSANGRTASGNSRNSVNNPSTLRPTVTPQERLLRNFGNQANSRTSAHNAAANQASHNAAENLAARAAAENVQIERRVSFAPIVQCMSPNNSRTPPQTPNALKSSPLQPPPLIPPLIPPLLSLITCNINKPHQPIRQEVPPTKLTPKEELAILVTKLNLSEPKYKINKETGNFLGSVTVEGKKWISYPKKSDTAEDAEQEAAKNAVNGLNAHYAQLHDKQLTRITTDKELIKRRLIEIICIHKSGIFAEQLPFYYKEQYNESLPDNWVSIAEECSTELAFDNGIAGSTILVPYNPVVSQYNQSRTSDTTVMKKLVLPDDVYLPIYIKNFINIDEIWGVVIGENYSDEDYAMSIEMVKFYQRQTECAKNIEIDNYYVVKTDDGCHRVRVDGVDSRSRRADVFFIDFGDYELVSFDQLYTLDKRFYNVAPQAIRFSFTEFEQFAEFECVRNLGNSLLQDLSCYCHVTEKGQSDDGNVVISGTFYDTSGENEINLNDSILQSLIEEMKKFPFQTVNHALEIFISHIELNRDIFVHVNNENLSIMNSLLNNWPMSANMTNPDLLAGIIDNSRVYLVQGTDNRRYRGKVIEHDSDNKIKVFLIDYGNVISVSAKKQHSLSILSPTLESIPPLAYRIELHNVEKLNFTKIMIDRLRELAPPTEILLAKIMKVPGNPSKPTCVELFKRNKDDNVLISIDNTLVLGSTIESGNEDGNNNLRPKKRNSRIINKKDQGLGLLSKPEIPQIGDLFDVHVTNVVSNPYHFIVQPYASSGMMNAMMEQLDKYCSSYEGPKLSDDLMVQGTLCAAKHSDKWYRAYIIGTIPEQVVIYLCDTGEMTTIYNDQVLPLSQPFLELPYQAIKAKLYGVKPISTDDWSPLTSNRFKELVADKDFVSVVKNIERDENAPIKLIITLELIDTSTPNDIKIHEVLIEEERAKELTVTN